jgi:hypothetical protein
MDDNTILTYKLANPEPFWHAPVGFNRGNLSLGASEYLRTMETILSPITDRLLFEEEQNANA